MLHAAEERRRSNLGGLVVAAAALCACVGCEGAEGDYDLIFESDVLEYYSDQTLPVCGGTFEFVDAFIITFGETLPAGRLLDEPVRYFFLDEDAVRDICAPAAYCTAEGHIRAFGASSLHELVHAVRQRAYGGTVPGISALEEGLAVYHDVGFQNYTGGYLDDAELANPAYRLAPEHYALAGHFTGFLRGLVSPTEFSDFVDSTVGLSGLNAYSAPYRESTGRDWRDDLTAYYESPECPAYAFVNRPVECAADPAMILSGVAVSQVEFPAFSCGSQDAIGPTEGRIWAHVLVENGTGLDLPYSISVTSTEVDDAKFRFEVSPCGGGCLHGEDSFDLTWQSGDALMVDVPPGKSLVRFAHSYLVSADVRVTFTPVAALEDSGTDDTR
jgi:hypothetical protein